MLHPSPSPSPWSYCSSLSSMVIMAPFPFPCLSAPPSHSYLSSSQLESWSVPLSHLPYDPRCALHGCCYQLLYARKKIDEYSSAGLMRRVALALRVVRSVSALEHHPT